jgi:hypothetical protein
MCVEMHGNVWDMPLLSARKKINATTMQNSILFIDRYGSRPISPTNLLSTRGLVTKGYHPGTDRDVDFAENPGRVSRGFYLS